MRLDAIFMALARLCMKIYEKPRLYDLAFRRPIVSTHVDGLIECHGQFRKGRKLENVLELAAGPARHALEFGRRGYFAAALDLSPDMCTYAAAMAAQNSVPLHVFQGNVRDFTIPHKYDLAMILLNSVGHLYTAKDLSDHLNAVWRHLNDDGLYVIEAHYPPWIERKDIGRSEWPVDRDGAKLEVLFGEPDDEFDESLKIRKVSIQIKGEVNGKPIQFNDKLTIRSWSAPALEEVFESNGAFEVVTKLGALMPNIQFDDQTCQRLVYVLKRLE